jgi:cytochrome P450
VRRQRHFGLGAGVHRCLGAALARLELRLFFEEWLTRIPSFTTAESFTPEIKYGPTLTLQSLPLRWETKGC